MATELEIHDYWATRVEKGRKFVLCSCGWTQEFFDPDLGYLVWQEQHHEPLYEGPTARIEHWYEGTHKKPGSASHLVGCSCGWTKTVRHLTGGAAAWEGHLANPLGGTRRRTPAPRQPSTRKKKKKLWSSWRDATEEEITAVAESVLGGTYYCVGTSAVLDKQQLERQQE